LEEPVTQTRPKRFDATQEKNVKVVARAMSAAHTSADRPSAVA
jgi:hypothetical protein